MMIGLLLANTFHIGHWHPKAQATMFQCVSIQLQLQLLKDSGLLSYGYQLLPGRQPAQLHKMVIQECGTIQEIHFKAFFNMTDHLKVMTGKQVRDALYGPAMRLMLI